MAQAAKPMKAFRDLTLLVRGTVLVQALLATEPCRAQSAQSAKQSPPVSAGQAASPKRVPTATYWFLGVAVGSFATAGVLLGSALSSLQEADDHRCAPKCPAERTNIQITLATADVMGLLGITCSALALYSYETAMVASPQAGAARSNAQAFRTFGLRPVREGAVAELVWRF